MVYGCTSHIITRFLVALHKANASDQDKESCLNLEPPLPPAGDRTESVLKAERIAGEHATAQIASEQHRTQNVTLNP